MSSFNHIFILLLSTFLISVSSVASTSNSSLNMTVTFSLSGVVILDRSILLTALCWCSLLILFGGVMLGSSRILFGGVIMVLLTDGDLNEVDCLTCNDIADLTHSIIPTLMFLRKTIHA